MKIEDQEVSLELAREMKELGAPQDSVFAWYQYVNGKPHIALKALQNSQDSIATYHDGYAECPKEICDAPTVAELGEMLKYRLQSYYEDHDGDYHISAFGKVTMFVDRKEADARAKMLIYLIKEGFVKVDDLK